MIFTSCPYCDETKTYPYETGDESVGAFDRQPCDKCGKYMFIERLSFGETLSEEEFWKRHPDAKKVGK